MNTNFRHNYSVSVSSGLLAVKESHGTRSKRSPSSESQDSGTQQNPLTTPLDRSPETLPGMTPLSARSPVPSRLRKSSCSSHFIGGPTCKSMEICQLSRLRLSWGVLPTTLSGSYLNLPLSTGLDHGVINGHTCWDSSNMFRVGTSTRFRSF